MDDHDSSYKRLFAHARMVRDLLTGFLPEQRFPDLVLSSLKKANSSHVTDDLRSRHSDVIWRVRYGEQLRPLYLLLEFQSTVDFYMPVRIATYQLLLYQDLIRSNRMPSSRLLAPVLPIVLYNGKRRWRTPTRTEALIEPVSRTLLSFQPNQRFLLIDEGAVADDVLNALMRSKNTAAMLFAMENNRTPEGLQRLTALLVDWLQAPEHASLRRAFAEWIVRVLVPNRFPGIHIPAVLDLQEVNTMLKERVEEWTREWRQEGLQKGLQEGLQEGREKGLQEGLQEGRKKGLREGLQEGRVEGRMEGRAEGRVEGRAEGRVEGRVEGWRENMLDILTHRFGPLPESARHRVEGASLEDMKAWTARLFDAETLGDVFQ